MVSSKKPAERLLDLFVPLMEREGYAYRKSNHRFQKPFRHGTHEYWLMFDGRGGLVGVDAGFFVRFEALEKHFQQALGSESWSAGATLLNARANPWKYWLNEERVAAMTPKERSALPPDVVHPQSRIEAGVQFLMDAHRQHALPLFAQLQTYRQLADFYREYIKSGYSGRCRPLALNVVGLALLAAAALGDDLEEIIASTKAPGSYVAGSAVDSLVETVTKYVRANDMKKMLT
jgi:hypothetical protein